MTPCAEIGLCVRMLMNLTVSDLLFKPVYIASTQFYIKTSFLSIVFGHANKNFIPFFFLT